jgi:pilus assembly protein Flp/PilA
MLTYFMCLTSSLTDRLRRDDRGASLVEYGLLVALIAVVCVGALILLGKDLKSMFSTIAGDL